MRPLLSFLLLRLLLLPISYLPLPAIHKLGRWLGSAAFYLMPTFRKRALSNLALASSLHLHQEQIWSLAKASFHNLMITCLEYGKLARTSQISKLVHCENPQVAEQLMREGQPPIFFCGHQANWELLFLEGTSRMSGVAIGRPIKNRFLYRWILQIRQKFGGLMITPKEAAREGLRALRQGKFLGIVGDQGRPDSGFCSPFFGRSAWTSPLPAMLAYKTGHPIIVASTRRTEGKYLIHYSAPLWPDKAKPMESEVARLMKGALALLETSIAQAPDQWLWQHNRWKQQTPERLRPEFRHESICLILPEDPALYAQLLPHLPIFREIYPHEFITLMLPTCAAQLPSLPGAQLHPYENLEQLLVRDFRFKLIFNFTPYKRIRAHFRHLAALHVCHASHLLQAGMDWSQSLKRALLRG